MKFNADEIIKVISEKTGISADVCQKVLDAVQSIGGGGLLSRLFGKKADANNVDEIAEKANVPKDQVSKIMGVLDEVMNKLPIK